MGGIGSGCKKNIVNRIKAHVKYEGGIDKTRHKPYAEPEKSTYKKMYRIVAVGKREPEFLGYPDYVAILARNSKSAKNYICYILRTFESIDKIKMHVYFKGVSDSLSDATFAYEVNGLPDVLNRLGLRSVKHLGKRYYEE